MSANLASLGNIRDPGPAAPTAQPDLEITVQNDDTATPKIDPKTGASSLELADGAVVIDFNPPTQNQLPSMETDFGANLAMSGALAFDAVASQLLVDIEDDINSRSEWMDMREQGIELLGLKIEQPRGDTGASSAPLEGMSTVRAPTLLQACLRFQANARGELLPAMGPVKVVDDSAGETGATDLWAEILEKDMNVYLTQRAPEYYPDTDRMLFYVGFGGVGFKKVYHCPLRRRPVSESVDAGDIIVNTTATDLRNAKRITHRIVMRDSMVQRMQDAGVYRNVPLSPASYQPNGDELAEARVMGLEATAMRPEDQDRTIYECLCEWDFGEHPNKMPLPYKIVIDKDSQQVLEIRRNWQADDPMYMPINMYVRYPYVEAMGFYCIGLLQILGNLTKGMTAAMREALDAGMFASFPGFLYSDEVGRQETSDFRIPPGGGQRIKTNGQPISAMVMELPYKDVTPGLMQLIESMLAQGDKLSGTAELPTGEGMQNAPVGTTLAIIDQASKVLDAVHKRLHAAQSEEFRLLKERFLEDPESFWRHNPNGTTNWDKESFVAALNRVSLVPVADPNTPTHTHRLMKAQALAQLVQMSPELYDIKSVHEQCLRMVGFSNPTEFFRAPGSPAPPNPAMLKLQIQQEELQQKGQEGAAKIGAMDRKNQMELAKAQLQQQTDVAELRGKQALEAARLRHEQVRDGAQMASQAFEHMQHGLGAVPPAMPAGAGPSAPINPGA